MLSLLIFIGEAVRDAFDPRKAIAAAPPTTGLARLIEPRPQAPRPAE